MLKVLLMWAAFLAVFFWVSEEDFKNGMVTQAIERTEQQNTALSATWPGCITGDGCAN